MKLTYDGRYTYEKLMKAKKYYPELISSFYEWIIKYWNLERPENMNNSVVFDMNNEKDYYKAIVYYISGMTDNFAIEMYNRIIRF